MVSNPNQPLSTVPTTDRGLVHEEETRLSGEVRPGLYDHPGHTHLAWGAVIAGSLLSISLFVLSASLAYACGVPAFQRGVYGVGAGFWSAITAIIAFFCGGFLVAYLSPRSELRVGLVHGLMAWVLAVPLLFVLFGSLLGGFVGVNVLNMSVHPMTNQPDWNLQTGAAWGQFISLMLGMLAACMGGYIGCNKLDTLERGVRDMTGLSGTSRRTTT